MGGAQPVREADRFAPCDCTRRLTIGLGQGAKQAPPVARAVRIPMGPLPHRGVRKAATADWRRWPYPAPVLDACLTR